MSNCAKPPVNAPDINVPDTDRTIENARAGEEKKARDGEAVLPPEAQIQIGRQLRLLYSHLLAEPLPEKFKSLLEELARQEAD